MSIVTCTKCKQRYFDSDGIKVGRVCGLCNPRHPPDQEINWAEIPALVEGRRFLHDDVPHLAVSGGSHVTEQHDGTWRVRLGTEEADWAREVGRWRQIKLKEQGGELRSRNPDYNDPFDFQVATALGELALARALNVPWSAETDMASVNGVWPIVRPGLESQLLVPQAPVAGDIYALVIQVEERIYHVIGLAVAGSTTRPRSLVPQSQLTKLGPYRFEPPAQ